MQESPVQAALAGFERLWMELLGVDTIAADDDFFELGGHSLSAIRLSTLIRDQLNLTVMFSDILQNPVYSDLREIVRQAALQAATEHAGATS
jgi:hypothetical protein